MGRRPNPQRRVELLDEIVDYITANGLLNLSLRPLATALGTSTYTLTYQFGTKEALVHAAIEHAEERQRASLESSEVGPVWSDHLIRMWEATSGATGRSGVQLLIEVAAMVAREPEVFAGYDGHAITDRIEWLEELLRKGGRESKSLRFEATLLNALVIGLGVDLLTTGDEERTSGAVAALCSMFDVVRSQSAPPEDGYFTLEQKIDLRTANPQQPIDAT